MQLRLVSTMQQTLHDRDSDQLDSHLGTVPVSRASISLIVLARLDLLYLTDPANSL